MFTCIFCSGVAIFDSSGFSFIKGDNVYFGVDLNSYFSKNVSFNGPVKFKRTSVSKNSSEFFFQTEVSIDVPSGCQRFLIHELPRIWVNTDLDASFFENTDNLIHPLVTAWCGGKKIEMDLELDYSYCDGDDNFAELLIGSVNSSNTNRKIHVSLQ